MKRQFCPWNAQSAVSFCGRGRRMWPQNWARERNRPKISNSAVSFGGQAADHDRRIHPENRGENGGFIRRFRNRRSNRRNRPEKLNASGLIGGFDSAARPPIVTADSPKMVKPRRSQGHSPCAVFAQNQAHFRARADVSEHIRETNYKTHKHTTRYTIKVLVWNVTCEENAHIYKYAKCVCASKSLQRK